MQEIVHSFDNFSSDEDESGEDRRLGGNSSHPGSSSALTGVGAAPHQPDLGSVDGEATMITNPQDPETLPSYNDHSQGVNISFCDGSPASTSQFVDMTGSPEADEGIDMSMGYNNVSPTASGWNWNGLKTSPRMSTSCNNSAAGAEIGSVVGSEDSNGVAHGSEPSQASKDRRHEEFENATPEDYHQEYIPDMEHDGLSALDLIHFKENTQNISLVDDDQVDMIEEPAAEIRLEEEDGL